MPDAKNKTALLWLLAASCFVSLVYFIGFAASPPIEGDAYEFAEITQNLVNDFQWREDHIRGAGASPSPLGLPHPPGRRGTLYVFLLIPFYLAFREHYLTVVAPYILCLFVLPFVVYWFGRKHFDERTAFFSALAMVLQPMFFSFAMEDPTEYLFLILLIIFATDQLLREKYIRAGLLIGLCFVTKESAFVFYPAVFLWALVSKRSLFRSPRFYLMILVSLLVMTPLMWKRAQYYVNPITCEDGAFMAGLYNLHDESVTKFRHGISLVTPHPEVDQSIVETAAYRFRVVRQNLKKFLFGVRHEYGSFPGVPETISLFILPVFFVGCYFKRRDGKAIFMMAWIGFFVLLHIVAVDFYENRYYFPILPFTYLLAFHGLFRLLPEKNPVAEKRLVILLSFVLAFEVLPPYLTRLADRVLQAASNRNAFYEFKAMGEYVQNNLPLEARLMTLPFFSSSFYLKRLTTFLPCADYHELRIWREQYGQTHAFVLNHVPLGSRDIFPVLLEGRHFTLYKINGDALAELPPQLPGLGGVNPLGRVLAVGSDSNRFLQFHRVAFFGLGEWWKAALVFVGFALLGLSMFRKAPGERLRRVAVRFCCLCSLATMTFYFAGLMGLAKSYGNLPSMDAYVENRLGIPRKGRAGITLEIFGKGPEATWKDLEEGMFFRIPIPRQQREIRTPQDARLVAREAAAVDEQIKALQFSLGGKGYTVVALQNSLVAYQKAPAPHSP